MRILPIFLLTLTLFIVGCSQSAQQSPDNELTGQKSPPAAAGQTNNYQNISGSSAQSSQTQEPQQKFSSWNPGGVAVPGKYADADIVELGDGRYRMYYSAEPEVPGFKGQAYSAVSSDGLSWLSEEGTRKEWATFPSVIKLPDGRYRMYFQNQGVIKSAVSSDGLVWNDESGVRIDAANNGLKLENVAAPTVVEFDNSYLMVYRGTINERYSGDVPNSNTQLLFWAISKDGLNFEKKGVALDSRNNNFQGLLDGPELVEWSDGEARLYFWSYKGIYHVTYKDGAFSEDAVFDYSAGSSSLKHFPENPPSDPTLARINGKWLLYYGQHEKGIFYATLEDYMI